MSMAETSIGKLSGWDRGWMGSGWSVYRASPLQVAGSSLEVTKNSYHLPIVWWLM